MFQLLQHANIRYQEALNGLAAEELSCLLLRAGVTGEIGQTQIGGCPFLTLETAEPLTDAQLWVIGHHSALTFKCRETEGGLLQPLEGGYQRYLSRDFSELLKYKGKTSAVFTRMLVNCAWALCDTGAVIPTVLDPLCGRGTTCLVALEDGWNSVGLDTDRKALKDAADHLSRSLQQHRLKHALDQSARTVGKVSVPAAVYTLANDRERYRDGDVRSVTLYLADTALAAPLLKKQQADILAADLPYGVQHAPAGQGRRESLPGMLKRVLPAWRQALKPGGTMALSYNVLTLRRESLWELAREAGFTPVDGPEETKYQHFVETAVKRDILLARRDG